tara:strand:- start:67719 stop:68546 length:828 start_codon:yes stop_codon:yes gene_type:complete
MRIHGSGNAHAGFSLLHAAGCGKGLAIPLELQTTVFLTNHPIKNHDDEHGLLDELLQLWKSKPVELPSGELGWKVISDIPIGKGLKSSSALLLAAYRALEDATGTSFDLDSKIQELSLIQKNSGCSITGGFDDLTVASGDQKIWSENSELDDNDIFVILPDKNKSKIDINNFKKLESEFLRVNELIQSQRFIDAFRLNGKLVAQAICDDESELICEDIEISVGGCSAAITGSGPAIVILCESYWSPRVIDYLANKNFNWIRTKILRDKIAIKKEI